MRLRQAHLRCFINYVDKYIQFRDDAKEWGIQSSWLLDRTYGIIHTLNGPRVCGSSIFRDSAVLDVFMSVDASDFTGQGELGSAEPDRYEPFSRVARFAVFRSQFQNGICT
jgi:hypothetical protein